MVATGSISKKCPPNIRAQSVHPPLLVSPISVAHQNNMLEVDGSKKSSNWMRDQWVANLKKKRMQQAITANGGGTDNDVALNPSNASCDGRPQVRSTSSSHTGGRSRHGTNQRNPRNQRNQRQHRNQQISVQPPGPECSMSDMMPNHFTEKDMGLLYPTMFLNDLGCFEIESPSFTRLTPESESLSDTPISASRSSKGDGKKWRKALVKKRCSTLDADQPKPRTPRRKLNCGNAFEDIDSPSSTSSHSFSSVGTPSNFNAEFPQMWGPEVDFSANSYVATFLDLPTPKSAEIPANMSYPLNYCGDSPTATISTTSKCSTPRSGSRLEELQQPKLIRTTSIEQEGLSQVFQRTHLGSSGMKPSNDMDGASRMTFLNGYAPQDPTLDSAVEQDLPFSGSYTAGNGGRTDAPSPVSLPSIDHPAQKYSPVPSEGNPNFDQKSMPEFETLLEEYKLNDIDQELDSFYLETLESLGGEFDFTS